MNNRVLHRFMEKVDFNGENGCWVWMGAKTNYGAGLFVVKTGEKYVQAHRFMYELIKHKKLDRGVFTKHICGNKLCVNPDHLEVRYREVRFWDFVDKKKEDDCWNWTGNVRRTYGRISIKGKSYLAHRYSYELYHSIKLSDDELILHSCHNRICVNPNHLRIGNHQENMDDMIDAGRQARGSKNGFSKLSESNVLEIKRLLKEGKMKKADIARKFDVSDCTISDIVHKRTWSWMKGN